MQSLIEAIERVTRAPPVWLLPYMPALERVLHTAAHCVAAALNEIRPAHVTSLCFVPHQALPRNEPYEAFIHRTGSIPTRDDWHDLFNGLVWLSYPHSKRRLNVLQAQEIRRLGANGPRGTLRDALTLFDENAALLRASPDLIEALQRRDWHAVFVERRALWQSADLRLFGHALMEKLLEPRKAITAHVWIVEDLNDEALAASLQPQWLSAKTFLPLPVLGVPTWWAANEEPSFYEDAAVFRPWIRRY